MSSSAIAAIRSEIIEDWRDQYRRTEQQIRAGTGKQVPASQVLDRNILILDSDRDPLDVALRRTEALLKELDAISGTPGIGELEKRLNEIRSRESGTDLSGPLASGSAGARQRAGPLASGSAGARQRAGPGTSAERRKNLYMEVREVARQAAFSNPLLDFDDILFAERKCVGKSNWDGGHMTTASFGHTQLDGGAFMSPELSFDGKTILFAYAQPVYAGRKRVWEYTEENSFHIFCVNIDGSNLVQLTDGNYNDFDPCYLPGGRIAFISTRTTTRGKGWVYARCFKGRCPAQFFLHSMAADGGDIIPLSYHETDEWQPSVNNDGMIVYTRWDYVDRNSNAAQHLWTCYPDGRDPRAPHGNYVHPFSTMEGSKFGPGVFTTRPCTEWHIRAVPVSSDYSGSSKYVATAGPHHGEPFGALVLIDVSIEDDGLMSQAKRITPNRFPESETNSKASWEYGTPWPLSQDFYLVNYRSGLYLLDKFGNLELICKGANRALRPIEPFPVRPRTRPRAIPVRTRQAARVVTSAALEDAPLSCGEAPYGAGRERSGIELRDSYQMRRGGSATSDARSATVAVMNAYVSDLPWPEGTKLKELRIIQYFPKSTQQLFDPRIGYAEQSLARMVLGTVPVEKDGSVYFKAPVGKAISFQLLDEEGIAVQAMRSVTYLHPGEQLTCTGCHESKWDAPSVAARPLALRRPPSDIKPDVGGLEPINFHRLVKPVLVKKCAPCHRKKGKGKAPDMSYKSLQKYAFYLVGGKPTSGRWLTIPRHGGSRSVPGKHGAYGAPLLKHLKKSHHGVKLSKEERRRITLWLDCNSNELGAYRSEEAQRRGEVVWPVFDLTTKAPRSQRGSAVRRSP